MLNRIRQSSHRCYGVRAPCLDQHFTGGDRSTYGLVGHSVMTSLGKKLVECRGSSATHSAHYKLFTKAVSEDLNILSICCFQLFFFFLFTYLSEIFVPDLLYLFRLVDFVLKLVVLHFVRLRIVGFFKRFNLYRLVFG